MKLFQLENDCDCGSCVAPCTVLVTECHNSHKHSQSPLTREKTIYALYTVCFHVAVELFHEGLYLRNIVESEKCDITTRKGLY